MKILLLILSSISLEIAVAQTNVPTSESVSVTNAAAVAAGTNAPQWINIHSDHGFVDLNNHVVVYTGNVVATTDSKAQLTCDVLTIAAPTNSTHDLHPNSALAEGNVKVSGEDQQGRPFHTTSDKGIYSYEVVNSVTNETITLTGHVYVESAKAKGTADPIIYNLIKKTIDMVNQDMQFQPDIKSGTNATGKATGKFLP
jgi:lipopolysaccharide transport protein LptA